MDLIVNHFFATGGHKRVVGGSIPFVDAVVKTDRDLLRELISSRSSDAFKALVERYVSLVYAAARRQVGAAMADDVTQAVFLLLWQRASRIRNPAYLPGWLVNATRLTAMQARRSERRRLIRETVAAERRNSFSEDAVTQSEDDLALMLDEAMGRLNESERSAVALRFLQEKSVAEIATVFAISETAAAKRISRGLSRLRKHFARRGVEITAPALALSLVEHSHATAPPIAMAGQIAQSIAAGGHSAASAMAAGVTAAIKTKTILAVAWIFVFVVTSLGAGWVGYHSLHISNHSDKVSKAAIAPVAGVAASRLPIPMIGDRPPIKVGVVVSLFNSWHKEPSGRFYGFGKCSRVAEDLRSPDMDVRPVIEAGSENSTAQMAALDLFFSGRKPIDADDAVALSKLDVIVTAEVWMTDPKLLVSLRKAVSGGVSLLNGNSIGSYVPDPTGGAVMALSGLRAQHWSQGDGPFPCQVIADHPILSGFHVGQIIELRPLGLYGPLVPNSMPLIKLIHMKDIENSESMPTDQSWCYPVYTSSLGKGKLICYQYAAFGNPSPELADAARAQFLRRCVRWLANRPVE